MVAMYNFGRLLACITSVKPEGVVIESINITTEVKKYKCWRNTYVVAADEVINYQLGSCAKIR